MATQANKSTDFPIEVSDKGLGYNKPQKMGRKLWAPMWVMSIMAFPVALILGIVRSTPVGGETFGPCPTHPDPQPAPTSGVHRSGTDPGPVQKVILKRRVKLLLGAIVGGGAGHGSLSIQQPCRAPPQPRASATSLVLRKSPPPTDIGGNPAGRNHVVSSVPSMPIAATRP